MKLHFDPFQIFKFSSTPVGLYARQKWLGESHTRAWNADFRKTVYDLLSGQSSDGSWGKSIINTIRQLFGLHLTVRSRTKPVKRALEWLFIQVENNFPRKRIQIEEHIDLQSIRGLPFTKGCPGLFLYGATLFLASIFGLEEEKTVLKIYEWLDSQSIKKSGRWCGWSCSNNILRAFVVHPEYSKSKAVILAVESLAGSQGSNGKWKPQVPFYQTINALAHLDSTKSDEQLKRAFTRLYETQNRDGTWGRKECEWNTFLVVHALRNKGEI